MSMLTFAKLPGLLCATSYKFTSWSSTWMSCMHPWNECWRTEWLELFIWFRKPVREKKWESHTLRTAGFTKIPPAVSRDHSRPVLWILVEVLFNAEEGNLLRNQYYFRRWRKGWPWWMFVSGIDHRRSFSVTFSSSVCHITLSLCSWRCTPTLPHLTLSSDIKT